MFSPSERARFPQPCYIDVLEYWLWSVQSWCECRTLVEIRENAQTLPQKNLHFCFSNNYFVGQLKNVNIQSTQRKKCIVPLSFEHQLRRVDV